MQYNNIVQNANMEIEFYCLQSVQYHHQEKWNYRNLHNKVNQPLGPSACVLHTWWRS